MMSDHSVLRLPGAVLIDDGVDAGVVAHYGSPSREERALLRGEAFTDLSHCDVVQVSGPDRLDWLNSLTTQKLSGIEPGTSTETILLDPSGHIENVAGVLDDGESSWLLLDAGWGQPMADFLQSMRFMKRVEVVVREDVGAFGAHGRAVEALAAIALRGGVGEGMLLVWRDPWPHTCEGGATYGPVDAEHPAAPWDAAIALVPREGRAEAAAQLAASGLTPAGFTAWEAARITAWRPRPATEVAGRSLPHELDWLRTAVHLRKGCYRGQEAVAKVVNLGKPPRRLAMLYLEGPVDELPQSGDDVVQQAESGTPQVVGTVTSAIRDSEEGPVALALLRRSTPADAVLHVGSFQAGQHAIVDPAGKSSASPATRPGAEFRRRLM